MKLFPREGAKLICSLLISLVITIYQLKAATNIIPFGTTQSVGTYTVNAGDTLKVFGTLNVLNNFTNNGVVINFGKIDVTGSWLNNTTGIIENSDSILVGADYRDNNAGQNGVIGGLVILKGNTGSSQAITGANGQMKFVYLQVLGNIKKLTGTLIVENILDLQVVIDATASGDSVGIDSAGVIINYSPTGYIKGPLFRRGREGTGQDPSPMIFPIADNSGNYRPLLMSDMPLATGNNKWVVKVAVNNSVLPGITLGSGTLFNNREWTIDLLPNNGGMPGGAYITLDYTSADLIGSPSPSSIVVAESQSSTSSTYNSLGSRGYTSGAYSSVTSDLKAPITMGKTTFLVLGSVNCSGLVATLNSTPSNVVCEGTPVTFSVNTSGNYDSVYYYKNATLVSRGLKGTSYTLNNPVNNDWIDAVVKVSGCAVPLNRITLTVTQGFAVNLGRDTTVCAGYKKSLSTGVNNADSYLWSTGATTSTLNIIVNSNSTFYVQVNKGGCISSDTIKYTAIQPLATPPIINVSNITGNSMKFYWNTVTGATSYDISLDNGTTWAPANGTGGLSHTVMGLSPLTTIKALVRAVNSCNQKISQPLSATTTSACTITYNTTGDTALCVVPATVTLTISNINLSSYAIRYEGNASTTGLTYSVSGIAPTSGNPYVLKFVVYDATNVNCFKQDSILAYSSIADASWNNLASSYCITSPPVLLTPKYPGGTFSGPGVAYVDSLKQWYFTPSNAPAGNVSITYTICGKSSSKSTTVLSAPCVNTIAGGPSGSGATFLSKPQGIYTDCNGMIYFTDADSNNVYRANPILGTIDIIADKTDGLLNPIGVLADPFDGSVYVVNSGKHQIVKITAPHSVTVFAGSTSGTPGSADGDGTSATFKTPFGMAFDATHQNIYVSDYGNCTIRKISLTAPYSVTTFIGTPGICFNSPDDLRTGITLNDIEYLVADANNLYFSSPQDNIIRRLSFLTDSVTTVVGPDFGYADGAPGVHKVNRPEGISLDCAGNIYFTDNNNCSVRRSTPNGVVTTISGLFPGIVPVPPDKKCAYVDGVAGAARFDHPTAISVYNKGFLDIADTDNKAIRRFAISNWKAGAFNGLNTIHCQNDGIDNIAPLTCNGTYSGVGIQLSGSQWQFKPATVGTFPITFTFQAGFCQDTLVSYVTVNPTPKPDLGPTSYVCQADYPKDSLDAGLNAGVAYASYEWYAGTTYPLNLISAANNHRYFKLPSPMPAPGQSLYVAVKVVDQKGCVGWDTIQIVIKATLPLSISGNSSAICNGSSNVLKAKGFVSYLWNTGSIADSIVANASGDYILKAVAANGCVSMDTFRVTVNYSPVICITATTMTGTDMGYGQYGASKLTGTGASGGINGNDTTATFNGLWDVIIDKTGKYLFVTEEGNQNDIRKIRLSDTITTQVTKVSTGAYLNSTVANSTFNHPYGILQVGNGQFLIADRRNQGIRIIDTLGNTVKTFAGYPGPLSPGVAGWKDTIDTLARFYDPFELTQDIFGNIYVTDYSNNLIRKITPQGLVSTIAGDTTFSAYGDTDGKSYKATFNVPLGIDHDINGNLFVTDVQSGTLRKINMDTVVSTFATGFVRPWNIVTDKTGNIFVSDFGDNSVKKVDKNGTITKIATIAQPRGIAIDPLTERLYVVSYGGNTVQSIDKKRSVAICIGDSLKINASCSNAKSYSWAPSTGLTSTTIPNPLAYPVKTTMYVLTITDNNGCTNTDSILVVVNPLPVTIAGTDKVICKQDSIQLGAPRVAGYVYTWTPSISASKDTMAAPFVSPVANSTYILSVKNKFTGCVNMDTVNVKVNSLPLASAGLDKQVCFSDSIIIGPQGSNTSSFDYRWYPKAGLNDSTLANPKASPATSQNYILEVIDKVTSCVNRDTMAVSVNPQPIASFTTSNECVQDTVSFLNTSTPSSAGNLITTYSWNFGDAASGAKNSSTTKNTSHIFSSTNGTTFYSVSLVVTDSKGCKDTATASITPQLKPNTGFTYIVPCSSGPVVFNDTTLNVISRSWNFGDPASGANNTSVANPESHTFAGNAPFTVTLIVTGNNACMDTVTKVLNPQYLRVDAGNDTTICEGAKATLKGIVTGGGNTAITYQWTGPASSTISTPNAPSTDVADLSSATPYKYYIQITQSGCTAIDSVNVTVAPLPTVDAGPATIGVCLGKSVTLGGSPTVSSGNVMWNPSTWLDNSLSQNPVATPLRDTMYVVTVTDNNKCINRDTVTITVNPLPDSTISQSRAIGCAGSPVVLSVNNSNSGYTIAWSDITNGGNSSIASGLTANVSATGTYKVVITNPATGCADSSSKAVKFIVPASSLSIKAIDSNCINQAVPLVALYAGDSLKFEWTSNGLGMFSDTINDTTSYIPNPLDASPVTYTIKAYNSCDTITATKSIRLDPAPIGSFIFSPSPAFKLDTVSFLNTSDTVLYSIRKWNWDFKDGSTSNLFNVKHVFTNPGIYNVNLTVTNKYGCSYDSAQQVTILDFIAPYVPNVFSPYATNPENKTVKVYGPRLSSKDFSFRIYNRWGDLIWETTSLVDATTLGWDGSNKKDDAQSMGVFTYVLRGQMIDGKPVDQTGTVTLIR